MGEASQMDCPLVGYKEEAITAQYTGLVPQKRERK